MCKNIKKALKKLVEDLIKIDAKISFTQKGLKELGINKEKRLKCLKKEVESCTKCPLFTSRTKTVFGEGNSNARIMILGEGPGKKENLTGKPFIGRSGQLLTRIIVDYIKIRRKAVYITNLVKCRPSIDLKMVKDRPPNTEELEACVSFLTQQIEIIQPKIIITLGNSATKFITKTDLGITKIRGCYFPTKFSSNPIVIPMYHPSYILRNGGLSNFRMDNEIKYIVSRLKEILK